MEKWWIQGQVQPRWNNYHFHVENFYDYLHLDREAEI
jgi:hypothetical protein